MAEIKICPYCQIKYPRDFDLCDNCGRPLYSSFNNNETTIQILPTKKEQSSYIPAVEKLGDLAKNTLVLFVDDEEEPILLKDVQEVVLGRPMIRLPNERTFDLTNHGAITLGVSRRHVRISYNNGTFRIIDLESTNGTFLNGRRIAPGQSHQLKQNDQLLLGQLNLVVYFQLDENEQIKSFVLTDKQPTESWNLTLPFLNSRLIPYIQALAEIQYIVRELRSQPHEDIQILYLQSGERIGQIRLSLLMADAAIDIVRKWIGPWQLIHIQPDLLIDEPSKNQLLEKMPDLIASVANYLIISFAQSETSSLPEKLFNPVSLIATSGFELMLESESG